MYNIFKPAIKLMNRLKYVEKFTVIFLLFLIPMITAMGTYTIYLNNKVEFAINQRAGLEYNVALRSFLQHLQQHRGLSAGYIGGYPNLKELMKITQSKIEKDIEAIDQVDAKYGQLLHTEKEWKNIKEQWKSLEDTLNYSSATVNLDEAFEMHTNIIEDVLMLNTVVSDYSKMMLQVKIENYYLVDAIINKLPWVTEYMGRTRAIGAGVAATRQLREKEYYTLLYLTKEIKNSLNDSQRGMILAYNNNEEIKRQTIVLNEEAYKKSNQLIDNVIDQLLFTPEITVDAGQYFIFATEAIDEVYNLIDLKSFVLDRQLDHQVEDLTRERNVAVGFFSFVLLVLGYLFIGFYLAVQSSISTIKEATSQIANGNLTQRVSLYTHDETKTIEESLNKMVDALVAKFSSTEENLNMKINKVENEKELLECIAYQDPLTSLPNRILFKTELTKAIEKAKNHKGILAVLFLDLDRFKLINDTLGHAKGDQLIQEIANRLRSIVGSHNIISRMGGDEFTILLTKPRDMKAIVEESQKILQEVQKPWIEEGKEYQITTSIGIAIYPKDGEDADTLIKNADIAMYRVKDEGKNNFKIHSSSQSKIPAERLNIETNLRKALEHNEFELYYQPKADARYGKIIGMEALLRWDNPELGKVSPGKFIPIAEDTGLIIPIGEWVLRKACQQNKDWQEAGYAPVPISVNISARQFQQLDFIEKIQDILKETGLDPKWLEIEITEGVTIQNIDFTIKMLNKLKEMGITISVDDFGKGFSSLSYIKNFNIDTLKIDASFVQDIDKDQNDAAIVSIIVSLAKSLKLNVVAEGVETCSQLEYLMKEGCYNIQGYLYSKPLPEAGIEEILKNEGSLVWEF